MKCLSSIAAPILSWAATKDKNPLVFTLQLPSLLHHQDLLIYWILVISIQTYCYISIFFKKKQCKQTNPTQPEKYFPWPPTSNSLHLISPFPIPSRFSFLISPLASLQSTWMDLCPHHCTEVTLIKVITDLCLDSTNDQFFILIFLGFSAASWLRLETLLNFSSQLSGCFSSPGICPLLVLCSFTAWVHTVPWLQISFRCRWFSNVCL